MIAARSLIAIKPKAQSRSTKCCAVPSGVNRRNALLTATGVAVMTASGPALAGQSTPDVGTAAPDFTLPTNDDKGNITLSDYKGQWVVLYFYPADGTSGCTIEARAFQKDFETFKQRDIKVLGTSVDSVDKHREFCTKEGLRFPLLSDVDGKVSESYGAALKFGPKVFSNRFTFLIDPEGTIQKVYTNVNPSIHSQEVLAAIEELKA